MNESTHEHDIDRFDTWARTYDASWMQRVLFGPVYRATLALAARQGFEPATVLDVGCGTGTLLRQAKTDWPDAQLLGVDPAPHMIEVATRLSPDATFVVGMAEALPVPDATVDLALSTLSFHHWRDQAAGLREVARVLRPGGVLLLVDMSFPSWLLRPLRLQRVHSRAGRATLFQQAGLSVQAQYRVAWTGILGTIGRT
jgi:ubiquinone/menaquinone biosynthesis C-methylase UbiE